MTDLEKKALYVIRNHSHRFIEKPTESDIENREMDLYIQGYKQGQRDLKQNSSNAEHKLSIVTQLIEKVIEMKTLFVGFDSDKLRESEKEIISKSIYREFDNLLFFLNEEKQMIIDSKKLG